MMYALRLSYSNHYGGLFHEELVLFPLRVLFE